jgi:hypothetical protein
MPTTSPTTSSIGPAESPSIKGASTTQIALSDPTVGSLPYFRESESIAAVSQPESPQLVGQANESDVQAFVDAIRSPSLVISPSTSLGKVGPVLETRQYWEGTVTDVRDKEFVAVVRDRTNRGNPDEEVVIDVDEVAPIDRPLITEGALFYWFIGPQRTPAGVQNNLSSLRFRRMPNWTSSALRRAEQRARDLAFVIAPREQ